MVIAVAVRSNLLPPKEMRLIWAYSRDHARSSYWGSFWQCRLGCHQASGAGKIGQIAG